MKILGRLVESCLMTIHQTCPWCGGSGISVLGNKSYCPPCDEKGWMTTEEIYEWIKKPSWQTVDAIVAIEKLEGLEETKKKQIAKRTTKSRLTNDLESLEAMLERGSLTEAEFKIAKQEILGKSEVEHDPKTDRRKSKSKKQVIKNKHELIDVGYKLKVGDDVEHPSFGKGVIVNICGSGMSVEATIEFENHGKKHLAIAWAPLKKVK